MASDIESSVAPTLLALLRCPETGQRLAIASPGILARVCAEKLRNRAGQPVELPLEAALVREDGAALYVVRRGIPIMLIEESVPLPPGMAAAGGNDKPLV
jgi:uncharacterized protein YbaR (Trm112 family)